MKLKRCTFLLAAAIAAANFGWCAAAESFIAASVKLSASQEPLVYSNGLRSGGLAPIPSGPIATLSWPRVTLKGMLVSAYSLRLWQVVGPSWIEDTYYDVTAKVPAGAGPQQIAEMLRNLLVERFDLSVRWETKSVNGWALVIGPSPLKLKRTSMPGDPTDFDPDGVPNHRVSFRSKDKVLTVAYKGKSMHGLANGLWADIGEPVQDTTGLKGAFDIILEGDQESPTALKMSVASMKRELRRQGLDLVRQKVQTKSLRVESATKTPKPN